MKRKFTTYKYEPELSGSLNYAMAREHSARLGRFHMPDPVQSVSRHNPQLLNRYAYVGGDPINAADPSGAVPWWFWCLVSDDYWPDYSFGFIDWPDLGDPGEPSSSCIALQDAVAECDVNLVETVTPVPRVKCDGSQYYVSGVRLANSNGGIATLDPRPPNTKVFFVRSIGINVVKEQRDARDLTYSEIFNVFGTFGPQRFEVHWTLTLNCGGVLQYSQTPNRYMKCRPLRK